MHYPKIFVLTFFLCLPAVASVAEGLGTRITLGGEMNPEVIDFIATQSVTFETERTTGRIEDLVRENCGFVSSSNLRVFERAVEVQGGELLDDGEFRVRGETTTVPSCLPDEQERIVVGRLPALGDRVLDHAATDFGLERQTTETIFANAILRQQQFGAKNIVVFDYVNPSSSGLLTSTGLDHIDLTALFQERFDAAQLDPTDRSRVAYEGFAVAHELNAAGVNTDSMQTALEQALAGLGTPDPGIIVRDIHRAIEHRQDIPRFAEVPLWAATCQSISFLCDSEAAGTRIRVTDSSPTIIGGLNNVARVHTGYEIGQSVAYLTTERVHQTALMAMKSVEGLPGEMQVATAAPAHPKVVLFTDIRNVADEGEEHQCGNGASVNWGTDAFRSKFRSVTNEAIARKKHEAGYVNETDLMVLDGGFARFEAESFGSTEWVWLQDPKQRHTDAKGAAGLSPDPFSKLVHGTAVTSLVMGGPGLMDLVADDHLRIRVHSRPIYRPLFPGGVLEYRLIDSISNAAREGSFDVINMSFGAHDKDVAELETMKSELLGSAGALFVLAAGNLGMVGGKEGGPLNRIGLVPQKWSNSGKGKQNMVVVAASDVASDPNKLAWFSNFGKEFVFLSAPGCRISALAPTPEGTYETSQFNGTSFAAPIVSYVAAALHSVMPINRRAPYWLRARLLATADIEPAIDNEEQVNKGRMLNPINAMRVYDDIVTLLPTEDTPTPKPLIGQITKIATSEVMRITYLCEAGHQEEHDLLRYFTLPKPADPSVQQGWVDIMTKDAEMQTLKCNLKQGANLWINLEAGLEKKRLEEIQDIIFSFSR